MIAVADEGKLVDLDTKLRGQVDEAVEDAVEAKERGISGQRSRSKGHRIGTGPFMVVTHIVTRVPRGPKVIHWTSCSIAQVQSRQW